MIRPRDQVPETAAGKKRRLISRLLLLGLSLIIALTAAEFMARQLSPTYKRLHSEPHPFVRPHPSRGHELIPGYHGHDNIWGVEFRVNGLGFRGPEVSRKKPAGVFRVLVLGDSIVMGSGLTESILVSSVLQEFLIRQIPGQKFEVVNGGVAGYGIREERLLLEEVGLELAPDVVVLVSCLNDIPGTIPADLINPLRELPFPGKHWLFEHSALAFIVRGAYLKIGLKRDTRLYGIFSAERNPKTLARIEQGFREYDAELAKIAEDCSARGVKLILVLTPHAAQFEDERKLFTPQHRIAQMAKKLGVRFIDMTAAFATRPGGELPYIFPDPVHPNPEGHRLMAEQIMGAIIRQGPLEWRSR